MIGIEARDAVMGEWPVNSNLFRWSQLFRRGLNVGRMHRTRHDSDGN